MPTTPRQFRLADATLADLDRIKLHLEDSHGTEYSRADAIRVAVKEYVRRLDRAKKTSKNSPE